MRLIRGSEINDFLRCRLRWDYRWNQNLKAKKPDGKLFFGTLGHKFMESYYSNAKGVARTVAMADMYQLFEETDKTLMEQVDIDGLWETVTAVADNYVEQWGHVDRNWTILATEFTFAVRLDDDIYYTGTIDLLYLDENMNLMFSDYKFVANMEDYTKASDMDRQISRYWWALQQLARGNGYVLNGDQWVHVSEFWLYSELKEPHGFVYNIVAKSVPHPPKVLKKGNLSVDKQQRTTYKLYMQALRDNGLMINVDEFEVIPEEYDEILQMLQANETPEGNRYFRRLTVYRQQPEIDAAIMEFYHQAKESEYVRACAKTALWEDHPTGSIFSYNPIHRNINHNCSWDCEFKSLCVGSMDGSNVSMIKNFLYEVKEDESVPLEPI